jgi:hypothetical protein
MRAGIAALCCSAVLAGCAPPIGEICDDTNNPCASGLSCIHARCQTASCSDGLRNGDETGVDCGGSCAAKCDDGTACSLGGDCKSGLCNTGRCIETACSDHVKNGDETGVDCGGICPARCSAGQGCTGASSCVSGVCTNNLCMPTCTDGERDGDETDVDCGGSCAAKCPTDRGCAAPADCQRPANASPTCLGNVCAFSCNSGFHANGSTCVADTDACCGGGCANCTTAFSNGTGACSTSGTCALVSCNPNYVPINGVCVSSADTDCGDAHLNCTTWFSNAWGKCVSGTCVFDRCYSGFHLSGSTCVADSCGDQIQNQDETGIDCGGVCDAQGKTCAVGTRCASGADCVTQYCAGGVCAACEATTSHVCNNSCVPNSSVNSCGSSCTPCPTPSDPNAHAICAGTPPSCGTACDPNYALHNGVCSGLVDTCCGADCYDCTQDGSGWTCANFVCVCKTRTCTF